MAKIRHIMAYEVLDSRGNPTIMTEVSLASGSRGTAYIPSGASTGSQEALELRDNDSSRYNGKGVLKAIENVNITLRDNLLGKDIFSQSELDDAMRRLDGSDNKRVLGANAILSVSLAFAKAVASERQQVLYEYLAYLVGYTGKYILPVPLVNIINGGVHADNKLEIQEFMILPVAALCFKEALRCSAEIFHALKAHLKEKGLNTNVGDEGGFAPNLQSNQQAIEYILKAIERAGYKPGQDVYLGLDTASTEFYREGKYHFENQVLDRGEWIEYLENLVRQYPFLSIEDGMAEKDQKGWKQLTERLGKKIQLVGDDLFVTNPSLFKRGIVDHLANAILIKFNQIGTLSESLQTIRMAKESNFSAIISHRSGETEDTTIADLAVGTGVGQIKTGSICRTDRIAKYNRLLHIEAELMSEGKATYGGRQVFSRFLASNVK